MWIKFNSVKIGIVLFALVCISILDDLVTAPTGRKIDGAAEAILIGGQPMSRIIK